MKPFAGEACNPKMDNSDTVAEMSANILGPKKPLTLLEGCRIFQGHFALLLSIRRSLSTAAPGPTLPPSISADPSQTLAVPYSVTARPLRPQRQPLAITQPYGPSTVPLAGGLAGTPKPSADLSKPIDEPRRRSSAPAMAYSHLPGITSVSTPASRGRPDKVTSRETVTVREMERA